MVLDWKTGIYLWQSALPENAGYCDGTERIFIK